MAKITMTADEALKAIVELCDEMARLQAINADLLAALEAARDFIAELQTTGCPAGPVAIPSKINDAIAKGTSPR